jgi:hypothetical protein
MPSTLHHTCDASAGQKERVRRTSAAQCAPKSVVYASWKTTGRSASSCARRPNAKRQSGRDERGEGRRRTRADGSLLQRRARAPAADVRLARVVRVREPEGQRREEDQPGLRPGRDGAAGRRAEREEVHGEDTGAEDELFCERRL